MISNLSESEFQREGENQLSTPQGSRTGIDARGDGAPLRNSENEVAQREEQFLDAIAEEQAKHYNARIMKLKLETRALELESERAELENKRTS